jgi:hypothetical protein
MKLKLATLGLVLALWGCGGDGSGASGTCRCVEDVPGGHLDLGCGESTCIGGVGYACAAAAQWTLSPAACTAAPSPSGTMPSSAQAICQRYMSCLSKADPSAFPSAMQAYGDQSPCWNSTAMAAQLCEQSCQSGLQQAQGFADKSLDCGCKSDAECTNDPKLPYCDVSTGRCQVCVTDRQCPSKTPVCSADADGNAVCQVCDLATDRGCSGQTPSCIESSISSSGPVLECAECSDDSQCAVGYCSYGRCENRCLAVAECMFARLIGPNAQTCGTCANGAAYAQCVLQNCKTECTNFEFTMLGCQMCRDPKCGSVGPCAPPGASDPYSTLCTK